MLDLICGKGDHRWQWLRRIDGCHLCRSRESESASFLEGPPARRRSFPPLRLVENFPGFPEGIDGPQLILNMHKQAENFGTRFFLRRSHRLRAAANNHIRVKADDEWIETQALIVASGASARWLNLENEEKLVGHGLTSCATCERTSVFYKKNVPVCVIGAAISAAEESLFLTRFRLKGLFDSPP